MPNHNQPHVTANKDGSIVVNYHPTEPGAHELAVSFNDQQLEEGPFLCMVDKAGSDYVTAYGPGLHSGPCGKELSFTVVGGNADVSIDGPSPAQITKKEKSGNSLNITYLPTSPGEYCISVKVKGKNIHGSPFSAKISGEGNKRSQFSHVATSEFVLGGRNVDLTNMLGSIKAPNGTTTTALLKRTHDGKLALACFQPKVRGKYTVEICQEGKKVDGSPFSVDVKEHMICRSSHVKVSGTGKAESLANTLNQISFDVSNAGLGSFSLGFEGPHRTDIELVDYQNGIFNLTYSPHEPGMYILNAKFGDDPIAGCPIMLNVGGKPSGRVRETVNKFINAADDIGPGDKCEFQLKIPGMDPLDMEASLTSPAGKTEMCEIQDLPDHLYDIKFVPVETGIHTVSLKHKGMHISGSPFQYTVGPAPAGGTHKVEIGGPGLEKGEVGENNEFNIYTREAGEGQLTVAVEGLSKAKISLTDRGNGYTTVAYKVTKPGDYGIHVKYNDVHVPDSPSRVFIAPESGEAKLCTIHGLRDRGLDVGKPCTFTVNLNNAKGNLKGHVDCPSGQQEDLFIEEMDNDLQGIRFLPHENGVYYVYIKLNDAHIPGSPFPLLIGSIGADPALVLAKGDGLEKGETGKPCKFLVTTVDAGTGALSVLIDGPSKIAIVCTEVDEGYEFAYTPLAPGDYLISIKFCNVTIAGCPSKAVVTGAGKPSDIVETSGIVVETIEKKAGNVKKKVFKGNASKVIAKGNGLVKAFCSSPGNFTVDVKDAGQGGLTMGMVSANGQAVGELTYRKQRGTMYACSFKATEKGDHTLIVRWGPDDIPGSPFTIKIN